MRPLAPPGAPRGLRSSKVPSRPLIALALALAAALPGGAAALADPEAVPATAAPARAAAVDPSGAPTTASRRAEEGEDSWLDVGHAFIEHRIFAPVLRIDRFFSDERDLEAVRARSFLRWRQELRWPEGASLPGYTTSVSANLKVPGLNKQLRRLQLEIAGQTRDAFTALFPGDRPGPGEVPSADNAFGTADAGVGVRLFETLASKVATHGDLGAGVMLRLPPGAYFRARLRFVEALGNRFLSRQAITGFWRTDTLFGSTGSAEIERPLPYASLARLSGSTTVTERSRGFEWSGDLSLLATVGSRIGAQLGFAVAGATRSQADVDVYQTYLRLRRDVYRRWLFVELAPEYAWPWTAEHGHRGAWAVVFRLEVQFQGNEAARVPPPDAPEPPEPKDPPPDSGPSPPER